MKPIVIKKLLQIVSIDEISVFEGTPFPNQGTIGSDPAVHYRLVGLIAVSLHLREYLPDNIHIFVHKNICQPVTYKTVFELPKVTYIRNTKIYLRILFLGQKLH